MNYYNYRTKYETLRPVILSDYYIGETVVTQELWEAVMGRPPIYKVSPNRPVDCISWYDSMEFIEKLNSLTGKKFRMPTEAEWEYAARGGQWDDFYTFSGSDFIENVAPVKPDCYEGNKLDVKQYRPNQLGIFDMTGFIFQWCSDWFGPYSSEESKDPQGLESGEMDCRVVRGGCYGNNNSSNKYLYCRSASRFCENPEYYTPSIGLRLAISKDDMIDTKNIVSFGEALFDKFEEKFIPGGAPLNLALACKQLADVDVSIVSAVGKDALGNQLMDLVNSRGVDNLMLQIGYQTGEVNVEIVENGNNKYDIIKDVAYDAISIKQENEAAAATADYFVFGTLASRDANSTTRQTLKHLLSLLPAKAQRVFDINLRPTFDDDEFLLWCLNHTDLLKINEEELAVLAGKLSLSGDNEAMCRMLMKKFGIEMVVLTMGAAGSMIVTSQEVSRKQCPDVEVVDTVGCGDSFCAALIAALASGCNLDEAHQHAVDVSSYTATQLGGQPIFPSNFKIKDKCN